MCNTIKMVKLDFLIKNFSMLCSFCPQFSFWDRWSILSAYTNTVFCYISFLLCYFCWGTFRYTMKCILSAQFSEVRIWSNWNSVQVGEWNDTTTLENCLRFFESFKHTSTLWPSNSPPRYLPRFTQEMERCVHRKTCTRMYIIMITKNQKQPKYPLKEDG